MKLQPSPTTRLRSAQPGGENGSTLLGVLTILTFLAAGLGLYLNSMGNVRA